MSETAYEYNEHGPVRWDVEAYRNGPHVRINIAATVDDPNPRDIGAVARDIGEAVRRALAPRCEEDRST